VGRGHQRDLLPLRVVPLNPLKEGPHPRRPADRLPGGLGQEPADDRPALPGDVPEPVLLARLDLARDEAEVPAGRLGVAEPVRVAGERGRRLGRAGADPEVVRSSATAGAFRA
jgi:hypothetical protein